MFECPSSECIGIKHTRILVHVLEPAGAHSAGFVPEPGPPWIGFHYELAAVSKKTIDHSIGQSKKHGPVHFQVLLEVNLALDAVL